MRNRKRAAARLRINVISAAVASCFAADLALANPTGPAVANGQVTFHQQGNLLQITNSPNAIINWQSFSIGASEITRFLQQSASSAVLNRVITQNPSSILGALQSNGRVFLINPNGILFGPGSQIDVAGLVASTLNLSDTDFLAGRLRFTEVPGAGSVINQGAINTASGGQVYLIGPAVKNEGVITSPNGEVILAAGNSVELVNPGTPNLRVEITAPDNEAVNLGQIAADAGRVGIYAGLLNQSGTVQANTAQVTEDGRIVLKATKGVNLEAGSVTAASGVKGGQVNVETEGGTIRVAGEINASGSEAAGGAINLTVKGSGGVDLVNGLKAGNATVNVSGSGSTTTLSGNMITDGTPITIDDSVVLGNTASITLDTTGGGAFPGGADVIVTGTINDDDAGSTGLTLNSGSAGTNAVGGAIGASVPIAGLSTSGGATVLSGGVVNTIGPQTYNGPVTLGTATTLAATGAAGNIAINRSFLGLPNNLTISADGDLTITGDVASGAQTISAGGDISVAATAAGAASLFATGPQAITAGGALTVQGGSGSGLAARILGSDGQTISAMDIAVTGGSAGDSNFAEIRQTGATGSQNINAGSLTITGGSGGTNSFARIGNDGTGAQAITGSPTIVLAGGTDGAPDQGNFAQIRANGTQNLDAGSTSVTAGPSGFSNSAIIQAPHQVINISGDLIVTGGGSTGGVVHGSGARIGGLGPTQSGGGPVIPPGPTDLTLTVSGDATVIGRGAAIGSATLSGAAPASIVMMVGGDLTLDTGLGAGARIGSSSASLMPGDMVISAGTSGAGDITLNGGTGIRTLGALTISTPGNLTLTGGTGPGHSVQILSGGNQTVSAGNIALTGGAGGVNNFAEIRQLGGAADQTVTVTGGGTLSLQGGSGTDTFANIRNDGLNQWIDVPGGTIVITGGIGPDILPDPADRANNFARIENRGFGSQTVIADSIALSGGPIGQSNFAGLQGTHQQITTTGDVTLTGGGSFLGGARIGAVANLSPTDVLLNVGGNLTMTGGAGSGATIGSNPDGGQPTDIVINAAGDITLNPGPGAGTRIGSPSGNVAGGNISLTSTGGNIALNSAPGVVISIRTLDNVTLQANAITQGSESTIEADQLTTTTTAGTSLGGNNQAAGYSANNFFGGDILFNNTSPLLTVTGINQTPVGALTLIQDGDLALTGGIFSGPQSISATGNIMVAASSSTNVSASGSQTVTAGGTLTVQGAATGTNSFARLSATGDQSLTAAGISVIGGGGDGNSAEIRQLDPGSSQIITINGGGTLELQGGSGGSSNFARIRNQGISQHIDFTAGGAIVLTGGSGASDDFAHLRANSGTQLITGWPTITMTGGTGGLLDAGNQAQLRAVNGTQTVFAGDTTITAGASGFSNNVNFSAPIQAITIGGDLTMTGGGSASGAVQGGAARIGGPGGTPPSSTNLTLQVSGDVTMTGGSLTGASIGSSTLGGTAPSDITMTVGGNLTLDPGGGGGARIGSGPASVDGGNIVVTAGGNITLNGAPGVNVGIRTTDDVTLTANAIMQQPDAQIVAGTLTTNTVDGSGLDGNNQVAVFNASNFSSGDVLFTNTSPLLTVTGINQTPFGALTLSQDGDLTLTGSIFSGPQSISATGDIRVVPSSPAVVNALGPQVINAGGGLIVQSSALGSAEVSASGGQTIDARFVEVTAQDNNFAGISNFASGDQVITVAGGGSSPGIDVQSLASGGSASIGNFAEGAAQTISVTDADHINVNGFGPNVTNVSAIVHATPGTQTISITGSGANAINVGSAGALGGSIINARSQSITAGASGESGSIAIVGADIDTRFAAISTNAGFPGTQTVSTSGALTVTGGNAPQAFSSGIAHNSSGPQTVTAASITLQGGLSGRGNGVEIRSASGDQVITVTGGGTLALQGGGGTDNFARIRANAASQQINVAGGAIVITGGDGPDVPFPSDTANNIARIENRAAGGMQTVVADTITMTGGAAGENNFAGLQAANQFITTSGDVTLQGGAGTGSSGARVGGTADVTATNAVLNIGGSLTLNGGAGSGAVIGSNENGGLTTIVVVNAAADITLSPGPGAGARIGSPSANIAGGNISLTSTGGNIALNSAGGIGTAIRTLDNVTLQANAIAQGDDATIQANQLTTVTNAGTSLGGDNQVAVFNATNGAIDGVLLHNASPSLTVTGVSTVPGPFTLMQDGDLMITGNVWSGPQTIDVSGDMTVGADSNSVILYAVGPETGMASGESHASWKAMGVGLLDRLAGHSPVNISARSLRVQGGSQFGSFAAITGGPINITTTGDLTNGDFSLAGGSGFGAFGWVLSSQDISLNIGGNLRLDSGTGLLSFARMQTVHPTSKINAFFPHLSSGGYFVNGVEGAYRDGLSGFFAGPAPAKPEERLITTYGQ